MKRIWAPAAGILAGLCLVTACGQSGSPTNASPGTAQPAADQLNWLDDFDAAKAAAGRGNKPILANFTGSDWCGWCKRLDREVFSQPAFQAYARQQLVLFVADFPRKPIPDATRVRNQALAEQYGVEGFPTILLLDAGGKVLARTGYQEGGAEAYVAHLQRLLKKD